MGLLVALGAAIGVYMIAATTLIARDGQFYIDQARRLSGDLEGPLANHPLGYPLMITGVHWIFALLGFAGGLKSWIVSAQAAALVMRLVCLIPVYAIGRRFVGARRGILAVFVLVLLPLPAEWGSDALRDFPSFCLMLTSLMLLIAAAESNRPGLYALAGLAGGMGVVVREEVVQLVLYAAVWLAWRTIASPRWSDRLRHLASALLFAVMLAIPVGTHIWATDGQLPGKTRLLLWMFTSAAAPQTHDDTAESTSIAAAEPYVFGHTAQRAEIHQPRAERTAIRQERRPGLPDGSNVKPCKDVTGSIPCRGYALTGLIPITTQQPRAMPWAVEFQPFGLNTGGPNTYPAPLLAAADSDNGALSVPDATYSIVKKLGTNFHEYYSLFWVVGLVCCFRRRGNAAAKFFVLAMMTGTLALLYARYFMYFGELSKRYLLPISVGTIFFVPEGLRQVGLRIERLGRLRCPVFARKVRGKIRISTALLLVGVVLCLPKLLEPTRMEKQYYAEAAAWLADNTPTDAPVASSDPRIVFYAERKPVERNQSADYVVRIVPGEPPEDEENLKSVHEIKATRRSDTRRIVIYRAVRPPPGTRSSTGPATLPATR